jgi:hypothetical protein
MDPSQPATVAESATYRYLSLINGLLMGAALALGIWLPSTLRLLSVPVSYSYASVIAGVVLLAAIGTLAGWLSGRWRKVGPVFLVWLAAAAIMSLVVGYLSYQLRSLVSWILDMRFWGRAVYSSYTGTIFALLIAGFFIFLALAILALLQPYRLEGLENERETRGGLTGTGWRLLLWPVPVLFAVGVLTGNMYSNPAGPIQEVHQAIEAVRSYEGDLIELERTSGIKVTALNPVRDQLQGEYTLQLGESSEETASTIVVAHFDSGAWINCRLIAGQLNFCYDASPPYTIGLASLISGDEPPEEECRACVPRASAEVESWLTARRDELGPDPVISYVEQQGRYVLMRAEARDGDMLITCWFEGLSPVALESCQEVTP